MNQGVSIVICCYNSEKRLPDVLNHLSLLILNNSDLEVVVVDNKSTDETFRIANDFFSSSRMRGRVVKEVDQGLSFARKTGVLNSYFEIVLFCDDDNFFQDDYLQRGLDFFLQDSKLGALGGFGIPTLSSEMPDWFSVFSNSYAVGSLGKNDGIQPKGNIHYGAGLFFKKEALLKFYDRNIISPITDRKGKSLSSGGDSELCLGVQLEGYHLGFDSTLRFQHRIDANRLTENYYIQLRKGILANYPILTAYEFFLRNENSSYSKYLMGLFPQLFIRLLKTFSKYILKPNFINKAYFFIYFYQLKGLIVNYFPSISLFNQLKSKYS